MTKVAIITGGVSGIGLAVATALSRRNDEEWSIHILDLNAERGELVASTLNHAKFHEVNVTNYAVLSSTFDEIFRSETRLDFVFANAGIAERVDFYKRLDDIEGPPPEVDHGVLDINLIAVINTSYLALHYFRRNQEKLDRNLVMTASVAALYPTYPLPMYAASKYGVLGFMRSCTKHFIQDGIRVNAISPGLVATNILGPTGMANLDPALVTPVENVANMVLRFIDGTAMTDSNGSEVGAGQVNGLAVELSLDRFYFWNVPEFADDTIKTILSSSGLEERHKKLVVDK